MVHLVGQNHHEDELHQVDPHEDGVLLLDEYLGEGPESEGYPDQLKHLIDLDDRLTINCYVGSVALGLHLIHDQQGVAIGKVSGG